MTEAELLRQQASDLRESARYAERSIDAKGDLNLASELEAKADALEGKIRRAGTAAIKTEAEREQDRKANFRRAFGELEAFFGGAKK